MTRRPARALVAPAVVLALVSGACAGPRATAGTEGGTQRLDEALVVLAASSLTDVVDDLAARLEAQHPGLRVETGFGASSGLAAQVVAGAPADVLVTASTETMTTVTDAVGGTPVVVAHNTLELAVPAANPGRVTSLDDLADPDLTVALCAAQVPCGALSAQVLQRAGVTAAPDTFEKDVRAVLTRLRLDEADAGLVYRSDVVAAGEAVVGIALPAGVRATTDHPALVLPDAPHPAAADAFLALLVGPVGRQAFTDAGFEAP